MLCTPCAALLILLPEPPPCMACSARLVSFDCSGVTQEQQTTTWPVSTIQASAFCHTAMSDVLAMPVDVRSRDRARFELGKWRRAALAS